MQTLIPYSQLSQWREGLPQSQRVVLTNGCFDILHVGHLRYLQAARTLGDLLVVGVNSDASVRQLKGPERPVNREEDRAELLGALRCVDFVTIFPEQSADRLIEQIRPHLYVKAGDYSLESLPESPTLKRLKIPAEFLAFSSGYSTSNTIARLQGS